MRHLYPNSKNLLTCLFFLVAMLAGEIAQAQVRVPFTQRTSQYSPTRKIYNIKGDFAMIGNTNMTLVSYGDNTSNDNQMQYVDIDGVGSTLNSSSATLTLSTENGALPACSNIVYAGLYWTGRAHNSSSTDTFTVTKNGVTKNYNKRIVSLKGPGAASYTTVTASTNDIWYPNNADGNMYSAYAEVTDYVRNHGVGAYTVADIALREGSGGDTGYYGGWSLVVVYENQEMKYRDITIFDGHAYVAGNITADYEIPVSGFNTVQAGPVNVKLGLMAGEGDRNISGDYFQIRNAANNNWVTLNHSANSSGNFFNSSIFTGGNTRNPNLLNNTGLDISVFNIPNNNNAVMTNNQTSTRFRYGTTQDTFVIFCAVLAVDAYIPEVEGLISSVTINGVPTTNPPQNAQPGQILEYKVEVRNRGTEPVNNTKIVIPVPYNTTYVANSAVRNVYFNPLPTPNNLSFDPSMGANGSIIWNIGTLPVPANPDVLLGDLTFKFKVTTDCSILKNLSCSNIVAVNGNFTGVGAITGIAFNDKNLIQGYEATGSCQGAPIAAPFLVNIDSVDYVNQNCQETPPIGDIVVCTSATTIPITALSGNFPPGTQFYNSFPIVPGTTIQYTINNPFPAIPGTRTYYAVPPNSAPNCYFTFTITIDTITTQPSVQNISYCQGATAAPLTATPSSPGMTLYWYTSQNGSPVSEIIPSTATPGTTTYWVAEGESSLCIGSKVAITVTVYPAPTWNVPADVTVAGCGTSAITTLPFNTNQTEINLSQFTAAGGSIANAGSIGTYTLTYQDSASGTCPIVVTRTFRLTTICGTLTLTQTLTIQDSVPPVITGVPADTTISCAISTPTFGQPTATDNCGGAVTLVTNDVTTPGACAGSYSITRTWTATDACGNVATASQTITVTDNLAPSISALPGITTISCGETPAFVTPTATDLCGSAVELTFEDETVPGACAGSYSVVRTWTAVDGCGNSASASQTINVTDTVPPTISALPSASTIQCPATPSFTTPTASDNCAGNVTLTFEDETTQGTCAGSYSVTRTWTATDACGNTSTATQTINVEDTTAPTITTQAQNLTVQCGVGNPNAIQEWLANNGGAVAADACSDVTWTHNYTPVAGNCSQTVTVIFTAADACGNTATTSATFTLQDTTAPVAPQAPADFTAVCASEVPANVELTATDNCSGNITVSGVDVTTPGACAGSYTIVRTWTFVDACGNQSAVSQNISVNDNIAPVAPSAPAAVTVACEGEVPANIELTATDNCGQVITAMGVDATTPGSCPNSYTIVRTWTFTDACGNTSSVSQNISVNDNIAPVAPSAPADVTVACESEVPANVELTATDHCGQAITAMGVDATTPGSCANSYTIVRTWTFTDACGNTSSVSQNISVNDNIAPVAPSAPADATVACEGEVPANVELTATDNCGQVITAMGVDATTPGSCANSYTIVRTWTFTDACGNTSSVSQNINVNDTVAPVIDQLPAESTIQCPATPEFAPATASDNCAGNVTLTFEDETTQGACAGSYSVTRTWTATDACGNTSTATQTINVEDTTAPTITTQAQNLTVQCSPENQNAVQQWLANNGGAVATDACSDVTWTNDFDALSNDCSAAVTVTFTATDACGNAVSTSATFTVQDTTPPTAPQAPADVTVVCAADVPANVTLTATDNCSAAIEAQGVDVITPGACAGSYTIIRTWTFVDACGNQSAVSQNISVNDNIAPVAPSAPAAVTVACEGEVPANVELTATDNCGQVITAMGVDATTPGSCPNSYTIVRTWTFTDACGNTSSVSQNISVNDNIAPVAPSAPADVTVACEGEVPANIELTATDNCGQAITAMGVDATTPGACAGSYTIVRTWTFTDACGNTSSVSQNISVNDTVAPVAPEAPADVTASCASEVPANVELTATDNCGQVITAMGVDATTPGSCANSYTIVRTWTFTDACGNTSSVSQNINVNDTVAPTISTLPAASTIQCPATPEFATPTATDNCAGNVTLTFEDVTTQGTCAGSYSVTRTWTATDACGNTSTATQTINVEDTTAPTITTQAQNLTVQCSPENQNAVQQWLANNGGAVATDACSEVTWTNDFDALSNDCSAAVTVTFTATDACGNAVSTSATFTVQDTTPPTAPQAPADVTVVCAADIPANETLTATDNCSAAIEAQGVDVITPGACAGSYTIVRTWTFVDACGNNASTSQTITVNDNVAPVAPQAPAAVTVACESEVPANVELTATDNCGEVITVSGVDATTPGSCPNSYTIVRTWTFADSCGNSSSVSQTIIVNDTVAPVIDQLPAETTISCPATPEFAQAIATDNCGGEVTLTFEDATTNGNCAGSYTVVRTWTATDACGNSSTATQTINVEDTTAPVIDQLPAESTIECPATPEFAQAIATDDCDSAVTLTFEDETTQGQCAGSYSVTRTWTADDACGNSSTATQTINVQDTTAPEITIQAENLAVQCGDGNENALADWLASNGGAVATDACSDVTWTNNYSSIGNDCTAAVTVIFTATDACGNQSTTSATFTVADTTPPVISTPASDVTMECPGVEQALAAYQAWLANNGGAVASDLCSEVTWSNDGGNADISACSAVAVVTFTATDACGNTATTTATFTVNDTQAPVAPEAPADVTVACADEVPANFELTANDECRGEITASGVDVTTPGECANSYTIVRTWTFTDECGNSSSVSQNITVTDTVAPVAPEVPADVTVACAEDVPAMISLTATDNCDDSITVEGVDVTTQGECANSFSIVRTWTFTDVCGNTTSVSQNINVVDEAAPVAPEAPADVTVACADMVPAMISLTATDNCGEMITVEGVDVTTQGECANSFSIVRTWTFTDACGNTSSVSQNINVVDDIAPVAPEAPADVTFQCEGEVPAMISLTATDNCGETITVEGVDTTVAGDCPGSFTTTRTWTFVDACGNTSSVSQTITVQDTIAPVAVKVPGDMTVECVMNIPANMELMATDNCGATIMAWGVDTTIPGSCENDSTVVRTWTFTDACGNSSTVTQTFTVSDNIAPTFDTEIPEDIAVSCDAVPTPPTITASDACGTANVTFNEVRTDGDCEGNYTLVRTWIAGDSCGNNVSASQTITVTDTAGPSIDGEFETSIDVTCDAIPAAPELTFIDNCSTVGDATFTEEVGEVEAGEYTIVRTWTVSDSCGNESVFTQEVHVTIGNSETNIPQTGCNEDITVVDLNTYLPAGTPTDGTWVDLDATGALSGSNFTQFGLAVGTYTYQYQITDPICPRVINIVMTVNTDCIVLPCEDVVVHNAFSPNGDGINDHFQIDGIVDSSCYTEVQVEIYNRWGIMVYETKGYNNEDRAFKGYSEGRVTVNKNDLLPTGTYFYLLQYKTSEGRVVKKDGYLYLSR